MKDQFVTYEIAKKLKELGFNESCFKYYGIASKALFDMAKGNETVSNEQFKNDPDDVWCAAPLWQQAIDWLREKHKISFSFTPAYTWKHWNITSYVENNPNLHRKLEDCFFAGDLELLPSYEQAREAAILKALELIKP